jgi:hypothetical protein
MFVAIAEYVVVKVFVVVVGFCPVVVVVRAALVFSVLLRSLQNSLVVVIAAICVVCGTADLALVAFVACGNDMFVLVVFVACGN